MLDKETLKENIQYSISTIVAPAFKECIKKYHGHSSDWADARAENFANNFSELVAEPFADVIAGAIDYYVKNAEIFGTVITVGSPTTQTARINSGNVPITNGVIPNTLGIR